MRVCEGVCCGVGCSVIDFFFRRFKMAAFVCGGLSLGQSSFRSSVCVGGVQRVAALSMQMENRDSLFNPSERKGSTLFDADPLGGELFNSSSSSFMTAKVQPMSFPEFESQEENTEMEPRRGEVYM